ncbi:hypothetical protein BH09PSE5_BH09PSE5_16330 [soil metagenome]
MHLLAEAAELEHNLLCSYLFAMFSLKEREDEGLTSEELACVDRWRDSLLGVCIEEMTHLAQVANLTVAIGGRPHLNRPNIPVAAGYHPASVAVEFTRLDIDTLDHFVFLERPDGHAASDGESFGSASPYVRQAHYGSLMPSAPNYETIGAFYDTLGDELRNYARDYGEAALFSGPEEMQLRAEELHTDSLHVIVDLADALDAIESIVREGEGSPAASDSSHFTMFVDMRDDFERLLAGNPDFVASRDVGRNPVMHAPVSDSRTHVTDPGASAVLDAANAVYGLMLRCLARCFETPWAQAQTRLRLVRGCVNAMKALSVLGRALTEMNAASNSPAMAGISFAMLRSMQGWIREEDAMSAIDERARHIRDAIADLPVSPERRRRAEEALATFAS